MNPGKIAIGILALMFFITGHVYGQTCCTGGVPVTGNLGLGAVESRSLQLQLTYDHNAMHHLISETSNLGESNRKRRTRSGLLEFNYGINERFSLGGLFPYVSQEREVITHNGKTEIETASGIGDMVLLLKYRVFSGTHFYEWHLIFGAGPKIPLGSTQRKNSQGLSLPADMQPGTGSWDGLLWLHLSRDHFLMDNLNFMAISTFKLSGKNSEYLNNNSYRFGDEFQLSSGFSYQFFAGWVTEIFNHFRYRYQTTDFFNNLVMPGTGGHWLYTSPGVQISPFPDLSFRMYGDIPVYRNLRGLQLTTSYRFNISAAFLLPLRKSPVIIREDSPF